MSGVNITVLEGGKAENFGQVAKLRTSNGTDHDLWVPKTVVETKHLSVKKNGLYYTSQYEPTASEKKDGKAYDIYGWDTITVSVKKKVKGKKRKTNPSTGIEYDAPTSVETDDNGNLVETELPDSIKITTPPDKTEYSDGDTILKTGMVVKLKKADGSIFKDNSYPNGVIPNSELTLSPTIANKDSGHSSGYTEVSNYTDFNLNRSPQGVDLEFSANDGIYYVYCEDSEKEYYSTSKFPFRSQIFATSTEDGNTFYNCIISSAPITGLTAVYYPSANNIMYVISKSQFGNRNPIDMFWIYFSPAVVNPYKPKGTINWTASGSGNANSDGRGHTFYSASSNSYAAGGWSLPSNASAGSWADVCAALLYGDLIKPHSTSNVTVLWDNRYDEGETLSDSFEITVTARGNDGGGGR